MQSLPTNLIPAVSATDAATQASSSLNNASNAVSSEQTPFSPLFSNTLSSLQQSDQTPFKPQLVPPFGGQELPLDGQLLPPGVIEGGVARSANNLLISDEQKRPLEQPLLESGGELAGDLNSALQLAVTPAAVVENSSARRQILSGQQAELGGTASQLAAQEQLKQQQALMMKQLALTPAEMVDDELAGVRLLPQVESAPVLNNGSQLSNMLRDAMLLKQPANGGESKTGESFTSAMGNLTALSAEAKGGSETKPLMQAAINTPFSQQASWGEEMGNRVKWMVNSQVQAAELKMNPAHLGPVEVKISVQNDQTTINFSVQNGAVREALETAMPRLREMLGDNGVNLVDVDVSDHSFAQQQAPEQEREHGADDERGGEGGAHELAETEQGEMVLSSQAVDYYA